MNSSVSAKRIKQSPPGTPEVLAKGSPLYATLGDAVSLIHAYPTTPVPVTHRLGGFGVSQHDRVFNGRIDPVGFEHEIGRFRDTMELVMGVVLDARRHGLRDAAPQRTGSADDLVELGTRRVVCGAPMGAGISCCRREIDHEPEP